MMETVRKSIVRIIGLAFIFTGGVPVWYDITEFLFSPNPALHIRLFKRLVPTLGVGIIIRGCSAVKSGKFSNTAAISFIK